jgi:hypothetical protein
MRSVPCERAPFRFHLTSLLIGNLPVTLRRIGLRLITFTDKLDQRWAITLTSARLRRRRSTGTALARALGQLRRRALPAGASQADYEALMAEALPVARRVAAPRMTI